jgi:hypothetical protein
MKAQFIFEKFAEESDPIRDMGIGQINVNKDFESYKEGYKFICKYLIPYLIGSDDIRSILNSTETIEERFVPIKNYIYQKIYHYVLQYLTVDGKKFDIGANDLKSYILSDKLRESFTEDSDPVKDMGIGLANYEKKYQGHILTTKLALSSKDVEEIKKSFSVVAMDLFYIGNAKDKYHADGSKMERLEKLCKRSKIVYRENYTEKIDGRNQNTDFTVYETKYGKVGTYEYPSDTAKQYFGGIYLFLKYSIYSEDKI